MVVLQVLYFEPFKKHLIQAAAGSSFWFAAALLLTSFTVVLLPRKVWLGAAFATGSWIFLWQHGVDLPVLAGAAKIVAILSLGTLVQRCLALNAKASSSPVSWSQAFVLGISLQPIFAGFLSIFGWFTPSAMMTVDAACILAGAATFGLASRLNAAQARISGTLATHAPLIAVVSIDAVRTNMVYADTDSHWYGYSIEYSLAPNGSFFATPNLASAVQYYPKLSEITQFSLSAMSDYSYQAAINVNYAFLVGLLISKNLSFSGWSKLTAALVAALVVSAPAFSWVTASAKADVLGLLMLALALSQLVTYASDRSAVSLATGIGALALAASCRTLYAIFCGLPILALTAIFLARVIRSPEGRWPAIGILVVCAIAASLVAMRTLLLTGFPIIGPLSLINIWQKIGFSAVSNPVIFEMDIEGAADFNPLQRTFDALVMPFRMPHIWLTWPSYVVPILMTLSCFKTDLRAARISGGGIVALATALWFFGVTAALFLFGNFIVHGGDGNYYLPAGVALALLLCLLPPTNAREAGRVFVPVLVLVTFINVTLTIAANWHPGLGSPQWKLGPTSFDSPKFVDQRLKTLHLSSIRDALQAQPNCRLVVTKSPPKLSIWLWQLPCQVETLHEASWRVRGRPTPLDSNDAMKAYLCFARAQFLLEHEEGGPELSSNIDETYISVLALRVKAGPWRLWSLDVSGLCDPSEENRVIPRSNGK